MHHAQVHDSEIVVTVLPNNVNITGSLPDVANVIPEHISWNLLQLILLA